MRRLSLVFCCLIFAGCDGVVQEPRPMTRGEVFIENSGDVEMVVSISGRKRGTVQPGECKGIDTRLGERKITVTAGDEVVYEGEHKMTVGHDPRSRPSFFLNVDENARYCRVTVVYGSDAVEKGFASGMSSMITQVASHQAVGENEEERKAWVERRRRESKFQTLMNGMSTFGSQRFSHFTKARYMLESMPRVVVGSRNASNEKRTAIIRIPRSVCDEIEELSKVTEPTDEDIKKATILKEMVDGLVPIG